MQKIIVHIMNKKWFKTDTFELEVKLFWDIYISDSIQNILFYKWIKIEDKIFEKKLEKNWIFIQNYVNREDITKTILDLNNEYNILYIHTTIETTMNISNDLKNLIWQTSPENNKIFRDKFIQRDLLQKYSEELWIKFISWPINDLKYSEIKEKVGLPFILKPINWVQSSWVVKINNRSEFYNYKDHFNNFHKIFIEKWIEWDILIAEEFINWELYSIDYFVWEDWSIRISEPIKEKLWIDIWIDDYFVLSRITTKDTQDTFRYINLEKFIKDSVEAMKIKNSFIHHEFKINTKWQLKTIEVNWRIGWWRHELMYKAFGINFFRFLIDKHQEFPSIKENVIWINIFPTIEWKLLWFNEKLFKKIRKLESVYEIIKQENSVWKDCWLTKNWFVRVGTFKLSNENLAQLNRDYNFIVNNYKELLLIESKYICVTKIIKMFKIKF